ncbi:MAG: hypothetical protein AAFN74_15005 [Myxococcota bacterium]
MNMAKSYLRVGLLALAVCACDSAEDEVMVAQATALASTTVRALTGAAGVGEEATVAQENQDSLTPPDVDGPCVQFSLEDGFLVTDFGSGCRIGSDFFSGAYALQAVFIPLRVTIDLRDLVINDFGFNGEITTGIAINRITAGMDLQLSTGDAMADLQFDGAIWTQSIDLFFDGAGSYDAGEGLWAFDATNLQIEAGACYPKDGVLALEAPIGLLGAQQRILVTFTENTPQTGEVQMLVDGRPSAVLLPAYSGCTLGDAAS